MNGEDDMAEDKFNQIRISFIQTLEEMVKFRGNDPMIARIYAMIVLSPDPLTQEQIAKTTGYSRSQISRYLANLEQRQMITKDSMPGSRTQLYGGETIPFLDGFRSGMEIAERSPSGDLTPEEELDLYSKDREWHIANRIRFTSALMTCATSCASTM